MRTLAAPGVTDPLTDPDTLARAVTQGILDAPQLGNNPFGRGQVKTRIIKGACKTVSAEGIPIKEADRLIQIGE